MSKLKETTMKLYGLFDYVPHNPDELMGVFSSEDKVLEFLDTFLDEPRIVNGQILYNGERGVINTSSDLTIRMIVVDEVLRR
jgi:hypothetical protein